MVRRSRREKTLTDYDEEIEAAKAKIEQAKAAKAQLIADMQTFVGEAAIETFGTDHFTSKAAALRFFKGLETKIEEAREIEEAQEEIEEETAQEAEENTTVATETVATVVEEDAADDASGVDGDATVDNEFEPVADGASDDAENSNDNVTTNHFDPDASMAYFQR